MELSPVSIGSQRLLRLPEIPTSQVSCCTGKQLGDQTFKVHLDGYNQMDLLTGKGPSHRNEIFYFTEGTLSAVRLKDFKYRFTDQPNGWIGATEKVDWPILTNLRLDPFERTGLPNGVGGSLAYYNWFATEFWRFVFVQQEVGKAAQTFLEYPPMQKGASFNMEALKQQMQERMNAQNGKSGINHVLNKSPRCFGDRLTAVLAVSLIIACASTLRERMQSRWSLTLLAQCGFDSPGIPVRR